MKKSLVIILIAMALTGCGASQTVEPTEVAEVEVAPTEVVEATEAETEVEEAAEPVEAEEPSSPYTCTDLSQTMYAQSTVNVRDLPEQTGAKLGSLTTNQEVTVTGQCNETGWYRISYNGGEGFVSDSYLGSEKVASQSSKAGSSTASQPAADTTTAETPVVEEDSNHFSADASAEEVMANVDANTIHADNYYCSLCGYQTTSYDEYKAHLIEEGVQGIW